MVEIRDSQKPAELQVRIWKYAAIGGRVVDERGEPVTGIPVTALRRVASGSGVLLRRVAAGLTDDRGVYRISQLTPGAYVAGILATTTTLPASVAAALDPSAANRATFSAMRLQLIQSAFGRTYGCPTCISNSNEGLHIGDFVMQRPGAPLPPAADGRPLGFANTFYPGTSRPQDAAVISLGSGESRTDLDVSVRLTPTVAVSGVLTGPDGPMAHVRLSLAPPGVDVHELFDPDGIATAITDSRGAFALLAITPGEYVLSSSLAMVVDETRGEGWTLWASQSLSVEDTGLTGLTMTMQPGVPVSGRVEFRGSTGAAGAPSQRQVLSLQPLRALSWRTVRTVVRPDGTFRSAGDPPGQYTINASSPPGWFWQTTSLAGRPVGEVIELGAAEISGLVLTFGQTTNRVSGQVTSGTVGPDPDAAVIVFPADSTPWREGIFTSRRSRKVHATSAGAYEIATLEPGDYYLAAVSSQLALNWQDPDFLERLIVGATRVALGAEDERIVALRTITPGR
jgi:hypothetical protein